jgi:hypothetical protein
MSGETLNKMYYDLTLSNEDSGNPRVAVRFSNASSRSGLSFGITQLDVTHNPAAGACLRECGFTEGEIELLRGKGDGWRDLSAKLAAHADIIERYDTAQLTYCLNKAVNFETSHGIPVESPGGILAGADYCNQYGSEGNGAVVYYKALGRPVTARDVLNFKLNCTTYGKENPDDCRRRYDNLVTILKGAA